MTQRGYRRRIAFSARCLRVAEALRKRRAPHSDFMVWSWSVGAERTSWIAPAKQVRRACEDD